MSRHTISDSRRAIIAGHGPYKLRRDGVMEDRNGVGLAAMHDSQGEECEWDRAVVAALNAIYETETGQ